jgi:hypothetical protein
VTGTNPAGLPHPPATIAEATTSHVFFISTSARADPRPTLLRGNGDAPP